MAKRQMSGRRRRPWYKQENKEVVLVPGFEIRNYNPDFDIIESHRPRPKKGMPYIPPDEIWIDARHEGEKEFLLKVLWHERQCPEESEKKMRKWLNERLTKKAFPPTKRDLKEVTVRTKRQGEVVIRYVRGERVRRWWDVWFVFGGHDLIYPDYIPEGEVWIDIRQDPREVKYTLHHELHERDNMSKGMSYGRAHKLATRSEQKLRSRELVHRRKRLRERRVALDVPIFSQRDCECGNTSLKSVCWFHGKRLSARHLGKLCGLNEEGIDHIPLAQGAARAGANVFVKSEGAIDELRYFLDQGYPIIVGWWSLEPGYGHFDPSWNPEEREEGDCGHYSVICHITDEYVKMMDPQEFDTARGKTTKRGGYRWMSIKNFLKVWYDTDTKDYHKVERWYMVVNFEGRTFNIPGGQNFAPEN